MSNGPDRSRDPRPTSADFRQAMGRFVTGVTVVTTVQDGVDHAMTASAFTSVSLHPPLVLLCVERTTRFLAAVAASGTWVVSVLDSRSQAAAAWLATRGRPLEAQLHGIPHHRSALTGAAVLDAAMATMECRSRARYDGGDHEIVLADVLTAQVPGGDGADGPEPLVYYRGAYTRLPVPAQDRGTRGGEPVR